MGTEITPEPEIIYVEDTQGGAAVSEALLAKYGATNNYLLNNFDRYSFGLSGGYYSSLVVPYEMTAQSERLRNACSITNLSVSLGDTGTAGTSTFKIEYQLAAGGAWTTIFSVNCSITSAAADGVQFESADVAPTGVTKPTLSVTTFAKGDKFRFSLTASATNAKNLMVDVWTKPLA